MGQTVKLELLLSVDRAAADKVTHLEAAIDALRAGHEFSQISRMIRVRFGRSKAYACRIVNMAMELTTDGHQ